LTAETVRRLESLGADPCGEFGEYHTVVTDCPRFSSPLAVVIGESVRRGDCWALDMTVDESRSAGGVPAFLTQMALGPGARCPSDALRTLAQRHGSGAKIPLHRMRGTVLLLESDRSLLVDVDLLRANELIVHHCRELANALKQFQHAAPDVVVAVLSGHDTTTIVPGLRGLSDHATSIIVASVPDEREAARQAGADSFLLNSAPPADLLYEIRRALILRRSGRRLPWNW